MESSSVMIIFLQISFYFVWDEDNRIINEKNKKINHGKGYNVHPA